MKMMKTAGIGLLLSVILWGCSGLLKNADTFIPYNLKHGSVMTQDYCQFPDTSVWVIVEERGECIRYFHAGLKEINPMVHVWFHGDRLKTEGRIRDRNVEVIAYHDNSSDILQEAVNLEYESTKIPYIRLSRPGVYGSSGDHKKRRLPGEIEIINAALDEIKKKYNIELFILSGQSGGGHVVASLLAFRDDIACSVITSGNVAVGKRNSIKGWITDVTGYTSFYDPIKHADEIALNQKRPIFIVGDPRDTNVPFKIQEDYYNKLREYDHQAWLIKGKGKGNQHHKLDEVSSQIVKLWYNGISSDEIAQMFQ